MDEGSFWSTRLRPQLVRECQYSRMRHHFERVENYVAEGTPDVDYCISGVAGKIELKFGRDVVRDSTPVLGRGNGLRRSQIIFASRRTWAGGRVWCVIGSPSMTWAIDLRGWTPEQMGALDTATPSQLDAWASWHSRQLIAGTLPLALVDDRAYMELCRPLSP